MRNYFEGTTAKLHLNGGAFDPNKEDVKDYELIVKCVG